MLTFIDTLPICCATIVCTFFYIRFLKINKKQHFFCTECSSTKKGFPVNTSSLQSVISISVKCILSPTALFKNSA
jgi:hypothetical protein